ncbi:MAG: M48 family metallopeptidase [Gaiellaceae bacterium]
MERAPRRLGTIDVRVRESTRARRLRVTVGSGVQAVVPRGVSDRQLDRFLDEVRPWIERRLRERVPKLGLDGPGVVWVGLQPQLAPPGDVERWYREEARRHITAAIATESRRLGVRPGRIGIRDPRTRWGSCSPRGNLSFSWRLVIAPAEVLEYVVVHELCHLRELNHSKRFYRLLDEARPGWRAQSAWLRDFGQELLDYRFA